MRNPRRVMLVVGALGVCNPLATGLLAQTYPAVPTYSAPTYSAYPEPVVEIRQFVPPQNQNVPSRPPASNLQPTTQPVAPVQQMPFDRPAPLQHVPSTHSGPIDLSKYSSEVLNCAICRERLGLAPLVMKTAPNANQSGSPAIVQQGNLPASASDRTPKMGFSLGGPGLITAGAAQELEASGLVVHEFKPPTPNPEDFRLQNLPPEARQQFFQQLDLPSGARVMSAQIISGNGTTASNAQLAKQPPNGNLEAKSTPTLPGGSATQTLGAPGIESIAAPVVAKPNQNQEELKAPRSAIEPVAKPQATAPMQSPEPSRVAKQGLNKENVPPAANTSNANTSTEVPSLPNLNKAADETKLAVDQVKAENLKLAEQLAIANELQQTKDRQIAEILASNKSILSEIEAAAKERDKLQELMRAQAESFEKKLVDIERSNQETAKMLEARTLEVTELQNKLQARPKSQKNRNKPESDGPKKPAKDASQDH